jgi:hypothetical protein
MGMKRKELKTMMQLLTPVLRHALAAGAGALMARGYIDATGAEMLVGLGLSVANFGWYVVEKKVKAKG